MKEVREVKIKSYEKETDYEPHEITIVEVDGEEIGRGRYGGEPEDNCRFRDYGWVECILKTLAEELGAKVEVEEKTIPADEWEKADY